MAGHATEVAVAREGSDVCYESYQTFRTASAHVRFTPNSDRESELPQTVMSALPLKADTCSATRDVRLTENNVEQQKHDEAVRKQGASYARKY